MLIGKFIARAGRISFPYPLKRLFCEKGRQVLESETSLPSQKGNQNDKQMDEAGPEIIEISPA